MTHEFRPRPRWAGTQPAVVTLLITLATLASAQSESPPADAGLARAQKQADAVFQWIKLNADKGAVRPSAAAPAPPAPAAAKRPTAAPAPAVATAAKPAPASAAAAAPSTVAAAAPPVSVPAADSTPVTAASAASTAATTPAASAAIPKAVAVAERAPAPAPVLLASVIPSPTPAETPAPAAPAADAAEPPLNLLFKVSPNIPRQLIQNFSTGFAQVQFTVQPDGTVSQAQAIKASHMRLGLAAVDAVKQWRFAPISAPRDAAVEVSFKSGADN